MATRRERVILELEDKFTAPIIRAAAATELLNKQLGHLSNEAVQSSKTTRDLDRDVDGLGKTSRRTEKDIDKLSGRIRILADIASFVAPALVPIGAVAVPAISGLASALGFATLGAGTAILAFQGVGDALKAVNKAALEPTAKNLQAAQDALAALSPEAQGFVSQLRAMAPEMKRLQDLAGQGLFPGLSSGLNGLETALPRVQHLISAVSTELGEIAADAGVSLGSERWGPFLDFLAQEAPSALGDLAEAIGNTTHGLAEMWMAFDPLNDDFSSWLVRITNDFDRWAGSLSQTDGFKEFVEYIRTSGPQVADTAGAIGNALLQVAEAIAPLGGPSLQIIESLADALAAIADSDIGAPLLGAVAAMGALNTAARIFLALQRATFGGPAIAAIRNNTLAVGGLSASLKGAAKNVGLLGAAYLALDSGGDIIDSFKRQAEAGDGVASTYAELEQKIQKSNVGKYAADFGIDVRRLAQDIGKFGDQGEYYKQVVDRLGAANDGLGGKTKQLIGFLTPMVGETEKAGLANLDLGSILDSTSKNIDEAANSNSFLVGALAAVAGGAGDANKMIAELNSTMRANAAEAGDAFAAETQYREALKAARKQADTNNAGIRGDSDAAIANRNALNALRLAWNGQSDAVKNSKREQRQARKEFVDTAVAMGVPIKRARELAREFLEMPKAPIIRPKVESGPALSIIDQLLRPRTLRVKVAPYGAGMGVLKPEYGGGGGLPGSADGSTVPKTGLPYADRHPYLLADGEEVISNRHGQADRHRGLLKAINADRLAGGGTVGNRPALNAYIRDDLDMKFPSTLKQWNKAIAASTKLLEKESSKRQALLDQAQSVRDSISSNYKSDLFGKTDSSVWMSAADRMKAGKGDVFSTLTGDIGNLTSLKGAIGQLKSKGLDGNALAYLLSEGSPQNVQNFATGPKADVAKYESLFNRRDRLSVEVGNAGASAAFGPQLAVSRQTLATLTRLDRSMQRVGNLLEKNPHATEAAIIRAFKGVGPNRPKKGHS